MKVLAYARFGHKWLVYVFLNGLCWQLSSQVVKENQILQKGDRTIDNENEYATLADVNIFAGDQIIVRDSEIHENRDIAGKLFDCLIHLCK